MFVRPTTSKKGRKKVKGKGKSKLKKTAPVSYLTHPDDVGVPQVQYSPKTMAEWVLDPLAKLDVFVKLILHVFAQDNNSPVESMEGQGESMVCVNISNRPKH